MLVTDTDRSLLGIYTDGDLRRTIQCRAGDIMGELLSSV